MLQLRLYHEDGLDYNLLDLMPDDAGVFLVDLAVGALALELAPQNFLEPQLVYIRIKLFVVLIEGVIGEMNVGVVKAMRVIVLLGGQPHEPVVVEVDSHGTYHRGYKHVDPEVVLVAQVQCWPLYILLHDVLILGPFQLPC